MPILALLLKWLTGKAVLLLLVVLACFLALAGTFFVKEYLGSAEKRVAHWEKVKSEAESSLLELEEQQNSAREQIAKSKKDLAQAQKRMKELDGIFTRIKSLFSPEEREKKKKEVAKQIAEQKKEQENIKKQIAETKSKQANTVNEIKKAQGERDQAEVILSERETTVSDLQAIAKPWVHSALKIGLYIFLLIVLTPLIYGLLGFFVFAPLISRSQPLLLAAESDPTKLSATESSQSLVVHLAPNQEMVAKEDFLQSNQEDLKKSTCLIWQWRYPITSLICGLTMLTRVRNVSKKESTPRRITFSHQDNGLLEVSKIKIEEEGSLVIRPHFIAGLIYGRDQKPNIRTVWVFNRLHSWVTFQFRHFIIEGPVEILVAAGRGIKSEKLDEECPRLRINRNLTVAFSPSVGYNSIKAETLMAYLRKKNPLFDDHFSGTGVIYNQQTNTGPNDGATAESTWGKLLSGIGKVFGL